MNQECRQRVISSLGRFSSAERFERVAVSTYEILVCTWRSLAVRMGFGDPKNVGDPSHGCPDAGRYDRALDGYLTPDVSWRRARSKIAPSKPAFGMTISGSLLSLCSMRRNKLPPVYSPMGKTIEKIEDYEK